MIIKFQQGGNALPPLVSYQPVTVTGGATAIEDSKTSKKAQDLTDKDLLKMLDKLNGLPSDTSVLIQELQNFYIDQQYSPFPNTSNIASRYLAILGQLNNVNFNHNLYKDALDTVSKNGGINEFAISDRGQLYCVNDQGDFKLLSIEQLKENSEYKPLTNSDLLYYRAQSPTMAGKNDILKVVKNGIGIETVIKQIQEIVKNIGTAEKSQEGYFNKSGSLLRGLEDFMQAVQSSQGEKYNGSIQDLYKYKYLTKDQASQAAQAIEYIWKNLPENARTLLKLKSDDKTSQGAINLIQSLLASQLDSSVRFELDLIDGKTKNSANKKTSSKDSTNLKSSFLLDAMKGISGTSTSLTIDRGDGYKMSVNGTSYAQIKGTDGKPIINTSLQNMLAESGLQSIISNSRNITFGDQQLSQQQWRNITYNNTGIVSTVLPINEDGTVRLDIIEDYEKADSEIKLLGESATQEQVAEIFKNNKLDDLLNSDGTINYSKLAPFLVTEGYTTEQNGIKNSDYVKELKNVPDDVISLIQESLAKGTGKDKEVPEIDPYNSLNPFDWFGWYDKIYKAAIYIPITNNVGAAVTGSGQSLDYDEITQQERKYQDFEKLKRLKSTNSDIL